MDMLLEDWQLGKHKTKCLRNLWTPRIRKNFKRCSRSPPTSSPKSSICLRSLLTKTSPVARRYSLRIPRGRRKLKKLRSSCRATYASTAMPKRGWRPVSSASLWISNKSQIRSKWLERVWRPSRPWKASSQNKWTCNRVAILPNCLTILTRWWASGRPMWNGIRNHWAAFSIF
mgnify:CR=1 FL=1